MKRMRGIRKSEDFKQVLQRGARSESTFFKLSHLRIPDSCSRYAFVISKAVLKRASARNLLRRRVREWIRKNIPETSMPGDTLILFKKEAVRASRNELYHDLPFLFERISIYAYRKEDAQR